MEAKLLLACLVAVLSLQGCATKTYGRMDPVDVSEKTALDCRNIDDQIAKAQAFIDDVNQKSEFSGADVVAFLIDFGIGNAIEKSAAIKSADERISRLETMRKNEGCSQPMKSVKSGQ
jgi:hypothetical protein